MLEMGGLIAVKMLGLGLNCIRGEGERERAGETRKRKVT